MAKRLENEPHFAIWREVFKCQGCATAARAAVEKLPGVEKVEFDLPGKTVTVTHGAEVAQADLARALTKAGFPSE